MRKLIIQMAILTLAMTSPAIAEKSMSPVLNEHVVISENVIRLGDLFANAGPSAEASIAYAPEPGKRAIFDARWLYRVAKAYQLDWQPLGHSTQAVVERDAISIPQDEIKAQLLFALSDYGVTENMDIELATRFRQIYLPADGIPSIEVQNINYQERTGRFSATLIAKSGAYMENLRLTGRAYRTIDIPVLRSRVLRGDIIREADLKWVRYNADRVQQDVIVDLQDLVGKTPKRGVRAGQPVRANDVRRPIVVEKNSLVTIVHIVPNMTLTAQGKALQNGSDGDVVQVKNSRSTHIIEAEVIGPGRVAVRSMNHEVSMNLN